ncbi:ABC-type Fe3+ transport system, substrate-binding protein [Micromonospora rhizosphaerae]|uniref:ABC-type Fe3+ transport system, substrate-binding protein n=1 Tax=Micromonospora rhizosphaerae TaxID=568872 RepID=A0A1C6SGX7_9ACTN|nr:extracellular solute-binding protein [Micromonospora rhizosphaerae]SCL28746.1 ABC-type Fe3+ transport system, substrate-binding protein [Micromonospora rhizosphaerae]
MRHNVIVRSVAVTAATLLLAACGASPTASENGPARGNDAAKQAAAKAQEVYDRINGLTGEERRKTLVELAEKEGKLSIYTSNTDMDKLVEGFEDAYDIEVSVYRGNSESVLQRILQEQQANYLGNDFVDTNAGELNILNKEGKLYPYEGELRDKVRQEGQAEGWTASRFNVFVVGWNTNRVKPGQEPKSFEELADPKWKGQVSMEVGDVDWFAGLYKYYLDQGKSEAEVKDLFTKIAANSKIAKGHTTQGELLSAGQFGVTVSSYSHTVDKAADKGAPVSWHPASGAPVQPILVRPNGVAMMKTAAHPAAAMLFADWELTEGQKILADAFRIGSIPTGKDPLAGLKVVAVPEQELLDNAKKWDTLYAEILEAGQEIK